MGKQGGVVQYTIRGVPDHVDQALRKKAAQRKLSLNQVILEELTTNVDGEKKYSDLSDIVGTWDPDPKFDEIMAAQRQIDYEMWK